MYMNFWYPVCIATELTETPKRVRMLKHDFVVFRGKDGKPAVLSDTCIHRGGSLAGGKCKPDGTVQCPYHGWRFTAEGDCSRIPSLGIKAKIPARARVDAYPVQEKYGLIFAFLGDLPEDQRPPIMPIPEYGDAKWRATVITYDVNYNYERSIENGLDPAHNEFVHPTHGYSGEKEEAYKVHELEPHLDNPWGSGFLHTFDAPPLKNWLMKRFRPQGGKMQAGSGTYGPNHMWTFIHFSETAFMHQYMFETPQEENRTRIFLVNLRNLAHFKVEWVNKMIDKSVNKRNMFIAQQDVVVLNDLAPTLTPPTRTKELLMPHDQVLLKYRDKLDAWTARGWRIDHEAINAARAKGDVVYAIPCPARRETKAWVLDAAPTVATTPSTPVAAAAE